MIQIQYTGRFGNQLFQYAIGRIISKEKNYFLETNNSYLVQDQELNKFQKNHNQENLSKTEKNPILVGGFKLDYDMIFNHDGKIILYGSFQDYRNLLPYKEFVKSLYRFDKKQNLYSDDLIGIHIRLTDYFESNNSLDIQYYLDIIKDSKKHPVIYTDDPNHQYIGEIKKHFNCDIISGDTWSDFVDLSSYKHICISQSSYSWWAAWLSDAEVIYYPISSKNYWQHRDDDNDANLIVTDENRYILV